MAGGLPRGRKLFKNPTTLFDCREGLQECTHECRRDCELRSVLRTVLRFLPFKPACYRRRSMVAVAVLLAFLILNAPAAAQPADRSALDGRQLYQAACAACHGTDGRGQPAAIRGFDVDPPDFTDCSLTTPEADLDWLSVVHQGGPARAFDRMMPAFGAE